MSALLRAGPTCVAITSLRWAAYEIDDKPHWIEAGRRYERLAPQATGLQLRTAFINPSVEVPGPGAAFRSHANVGFFYGAEAEDPVGSLEGSGKRMRHTKVKPGVDLDSAALDALIDTACADVKRRLAVEDGGGSGPRRRQVVAERRIGLGTRGAPAGLRTTSSTSRPEVARAGAAR